MTQNIEWKQTGDKEFYVGENRVSIVDDCIIYIEVVGEQTDQHAEIIKKHYLDVFSMIKGNVKQLVNLNKSGKSSPVSRQLFKELNEHVLMEKVAIFGVHPVARVLASFVIGITNKKNVRFFSNEEEALSWLK